MKNLFKKTKNKIILLQNYDMNGIYIYLNSNSSIFWAQFSMQR